MSMTLTELQKEIKLLEKEIAKSDGRRSHLLEQLAKTTGCKTVGAAEVYLERKRKQERIADDKAKRALERFEKKWGPYLEDAERSRGSEAAGGTRTKAP